MQLAARSLLSRFFRPSIIGKDISLQEDCQAFLATYSTYQYRYTPSVFSQQTCSCQCAGIYHVPFYQLIQLIGDLMEMKYERGDIALSSDAFLQCFEKAARTCMQSCILPFRHLLQAHQRQQDQLRGEFCMVNEDQEANVLSEQPSSINLQKDYQKDYQNNGGYSDVLKNPLLLVELCVHLLEGSLSELLPWLTDISLITTIHSQAFTTLHQLIKLARRLSLLPFTLVTSSPFHTRLHALFTDRQYQSVVPRLAELSKATLWMVPMSLPSFIASELEGQSPSLLAAYKVLGMYLKTVLRDASQLPRQVGHIQMACMVYVALELYFNGYDRFQSSLNEIVSVRRSDALLLTWYVILVVNCKGLRPSKEFAKRLEEGWKGKGLYLKNEVIG